MLSKQEWKEVDQLVDSEYMTQVDDAWMEAALMGVKMALAIINGQEDLQKQAIDYLAKFGKWDDGTMQLPPQVRRELYVRNYGEDEVQAMEEAGEVSFEEGQGNGNTSKH